MRMQFTDWGKIRANAREVMARSIRYARSMSFSTELPKEL